MTIHVISSSNVQDIATDVIEIFTSENLVGGLSGNNGSYSMEKNFTIDTTRAAFNFLADNYEESTGAFFVAINSNESMEAHMSGRVRVDQYECAGYAIQGAREAYEKTGIPIIIMFYDEATPAELYEELEKAGIGLNVLYKYGYGEKKDIVGANLFRNVLSFKNIGDKTPTFYDQTSDIQSTDGITYVDLQAPCGNLEKAYYPPNAA